MMSDMECKPCAKCKEMADLVDRMLTNGVEKVDPLGNVKVLLLVGDVDNLGAMVKEAQGR